MAMWPLVPLIQPLQNNQLSREEIERCEKDAEARLQLKAAQVPMPDKHQGATLYPHCPSPGKA